jgi:hypothetical protein
MLLLLEPLHQPFFLMNFFEIGCCELFAQGWLQIAILLISASYAARIISVSHKNLAYFLLLK